MTSKLASWNYDCTWVLSLRHFAWDCYRYLLELGLNAGDFLGSDHMWLAYAGIGKCSLKALCWTCAVLRKLFLLCLIMCKLVLNCKQLRSGESVTIIIGRPLKLSKLFSWHHNKKNILLSFVTYGDPLQDSGDRCRRFFYTLSLEWGLLRPVQTCYGVLSVAGVCPWPSDLNNNSAFHLSRSRQ